ncbi:unnamed protein product [Brassica oleracea]|uniref:(rape) hypothetical protein n=1 Tax=Brassica napus TaxID=3708 RepID=A0A816J9V0_BRANA|nr:unnamed protein product [Brassica napus]
MRGTEVLPCTPRNLYTNNCHVSYVTETAPVVVLGGVDACRWRQDATAPARTYLLHGDNGSLVTRATPSVKALAPVAWLTVNWTAR